MAINPDGTRIYVAQVSTRLRIPSISSTFVSVIDTTTNTVTTTVALATSFGESVAPFGLAVNPAGTRLYVTYETNTVAVIDTATHEVVARVTVGTRPRGVAVHPTGSPVYVANSGSNIVSLIDTLTNTVLATVLVGTGPTAFGLFIGPGIMTPVPTLSQWGMILLALSLLTLGTSHLGRPALLGVATPTGAVVWAPSSHLLRSMLVGQAVAGMGLLLYARLIEPVAAHDVIGAVLSGVLLGVLTRVLPTRPA